MLILASASPRRRDLLERAGIAFEVHPAAIDESPQENETPRECAERLARQKARAVFQEHPQACVLGADTVVAVDGTILGKPYDAADAFWMLRLLSGRQHEVITGVCLVGPAGSTEPDPAAGSNRAAAELLERDPGFEDTRSETTIVTMRDISDDEIYEYVATSEPMDKAGAYGIQGSAARWIPSIDGDYNNVVGLPVALVQRMLRKHPQERKQHVL